LHQRFFITRFDIFNLGIFIIGFAELLLTLFAFLTAPVSANLMAQAALHLRLRSLSGDVPEALNRPLPWQRTRRRAFSNKHEDTEHRL
jgi:multicomponent K+:H+ antiporter subunit G